MIEQCIRTKDGKVFQYERQGDIFMLFADGKYKPIKLSTFKRYYKVLVSNNGTMKSDEQATEQQVEKAESIKKQGKIDWHKYYKNYKANELPLWGAKLQEDKLVVFDANNNAIIVLNRTKTTTCVCVTQLSTGAKRYFSNFDSACKHICNNQDIRTIKVLSECFDLWIRKTNKMEIK